MQIMYHASYTIMSLRCCLLPCVSPLDLLGGFLALLLTIPWLISMSVLCGRLLLVDMPNGTSLVHCLLCWLVHFCISEIWRVVYLIPLQWFIPLFISFDNNYCYFTLPSFNLRLVYMRQVWYILHIESSVSNSHIT